MVVEQEQMIESMATMVVEQAQMIESMARIQSDSKLDL